MIVNSDTIGDIENALKGIDAETFVVFDCDEVLTTLSEQVWKEESRVFFQEWCKKNLSDFSQRTLYDFATFILMSSRSFLVHEKMPKIVETLQDTGIKTIVLTALSIKPIASILDPMAWRIMTLNNFGYDFKRSWPQLKDKLFTKFSCEYPPMYSSGIMCCGEVSKGDSLSAFLKYSKYVPKKVIFVDDLQENLEEVERTCGSLDIDFLGIQYLEAKNVISEIPFSEKRIEFQLSVLKEKKIWLSDIEAESHISALGQPAAAELDRAISQAVLCA